MPGGWKYSIAKLVEMIPQLRAAGLSEEADEYQAQLDKRRVDRRARKTPRRVGESYHVRPTYIRKRMWDQKNRAIEYLGGVCKRCGQMPHKAAMDFHHRDRSQKDRPICFASAWGTIQAELDKCDLVCSNCHRIIHWEVGGNDRT